MENNLVIQEDGWKANFPKLYVNAPITVVYRGKNALCKARVARFTPWKLCLCRRPGELELPVLPDNAEVRLHGISEGGIPFVMAGMVSESSRTQLVLSTLIPMNDLGRRACPRQFLCRPAELLPVGVENDDEVGFPCQIMDISANGACIHTPKVLKEGVPYRLRTELYDGAGSISFRCQVVRGGYRAAAGASVLNQQEYGLLFAELSERKRRRLEADLIDALELEKKIAAQ